LSAGSAAPVATSSSSPTATPDAASASAPNATPVSSPSGGAAVATQPATPPPPEAISLPAGTQISVRLDQDLSSKTSQQGDHFTASVSEDVRVGGKVILEKGSRADGIVAEAKALGKIKGGAMLSLRLDRIQTRYGGYMVSTSTIDRAEKGKGKRTAEFAGGGAALGALIGGLAGHGKGALIGGLAGAGAGTAGSAFTDNHQIELPAETLLTFRLEHSVQVEASR